VGSSTNGLAPVSMAERSLAAGLWQWAGLAAVVCAAVAGDQLTKHVVTSRLELDESSRVIGPLSIHRVENSASRLRPLRSATGVVIALAAVAVVWMLVYFARHGARRPVIPAALGLLIGGCLEPRRPRPSGHVTGLITSAGGLPSTSPTASSSSALRSSSPASSAPTAPPKDARRPLDVAAAGSAGRAKPRAPEPPSQGGVAFPPP
jgi:hypothetical protein